MDKEILVQYAEMVEEIKDIRKRIVKLEKERQRLEKTIVADTVKGTRKDGTYGPIKVTGIPSREYERKSKSIDRLQELLEEKEAKLLELTCQAEEYIDSIPKSELRIMFRFYYIDGFTWEQVAIRMNQAFPKKRISYTPDSCRMRNNRFFEKI